MNLPVHVVHPKKPGKSPAPREVAFFPVRVRFLFAFLETKIVDGEADQSWFDANPEKAYRDRPVSELEMQAFGFLPEARVIVALEPDGSHIRFFVPPRFVDDPRDASEQLGPSHSCLEGRDPWWFRGN